MTQIRISLAILALAASTLPALAGSFAIELPRLDFPPAPEETTRGCHATPACPTGS